MMGMTKGWTRRAALAVLATGAMLGLLLPTAPHAAAKDSSDGAAQFIESLGQQAINELSDDGVPASERKQAFLDLLERGFALDAISRFVLGRYWRVASEQQQDKFQDVFKRIMAQRFLPLFRGYERDDFVVSGVGPDPTQPSLYAVRTMISRPNQTNGEGPKAEVIWRVRPRDGDYEIVDVKAEGVSMAITLRSEYNAAIQQAGGNVGDLIAKLETNLAKGAYAPDIAGN
ncbi:MlaC/ttg2D family ABC transporter substrate-binding protein [Rhodovibrio salinarum]|nr:ABC transporter substrate-binding protein [Rhodovibrio salinarum]